VRGVLIGATAAILAALGAVTAHQVTVWKNSIALYEHSIAVGEDNAAVRYLLATALQTAGRPQAEVVTQFRRALEHRPDYVNAITQLAVIALANRRMDEARQLIEETIRLEPKNPGPRQNLGAYWVQAGKPDEAIRHFEAALALDPKSTGARLELGKIYLNQSRHEEARVHYEARARIDHWNPDAQTDYGTLLTNLGQLDEARRYLERALWLRPDHTRAKQNLDALKKLQAPRQKK
jgi:tetratricopeptide (TPR) repeat protein